ncbi:uncharacterized protein LOC113983089 [Pipra filicauda]|uniref:Uncharacterized protein LOC113983089 n=1 Tax=Pipra filicauda TaxID=649802 RepID=A0A6J2FX08_9PASS|nr:uncharacterized protein LOC113983089 [Pipra filicauda]
MPRGMEPKPRLYQHQLQPAELISGSGWALGGPWWLQPQLKAMSSLPIYRQQIPPSLCAPGGGQGWRSSQRGVGSTAAECHPSTVWAAGMEPGPPGPPGPPRVKAADGCAWQSLLCLRPPRPKRKVAYSAYMHKLLNQTWSSGDSCWVVSALAGLGGLRLLGDVALEAARLSRGSRRSRPGRREVLLAMKLVLLQELYKPPPGP